MFEFFSIPFQPNSTINLFLLAISALTMLLVCFKLITAKNLLESVVIMSALSLIISLCYLFMDAPDVAMTETALGSCLSTCVLLNLVKIFGDEKEQQPAKLKIIAAIILCLTFTALLSLAVFELPLYGEIHTPMQGHVSKYYLEHTQSDIGIPSFVAAILASYRGYDTLGETSVILIAGLAVVLILARRKEDA